MTGEQPGVNPQDKEAAETFEAALAAFAEELSLFRIACGSPSYATIASASVRPRLTKSGLTEMLTGKRLPSLETLLEFVRVVTTPSGLDKPAAERFRANPEVLKEWRGRWQHAKVLQRQVHRANKRPPTVKQIRDDVAREPEPLHMEADRMASEDASGEHPCTQAQPEVAGEVSSKEYVQIVEAAFDTTIPTEARHTGWLAGSLATLVALGVVALSWADETELIVKITYSVMIPLTLWSAVLADITNRTRVLDKRWLVILMYLMAAFTMGAPVMSYLGNLPAQDEQLLARIAVYAVMLVLIVVPLGLLSAAVDGIFPELDDEVKDQVRADRARLQRLNEDKQKAIQRARSWRRYHEMQGQPLDPPSESNPL
ncbi:hypothetical protein AB0O57_32570 [Streptomyces sp. NPDC091201]|uniref:hypothetical protein n=1 Tax=Streptomyces sp. NPDC091201 TaxID=3155190 RepID=UPI003437AC45